MKTDNIAISASAGSGKTFQLAHRYIRLLLDGGQEAPERICAVTFTRKAAGEIFDSIVRYLTDASLSEDNAKVMASRLGRKKLKQKDFLKALENFVNQLNRANIGTLDSFIVGVAKAFPFELGIPADFRLDESSGSSASRIRDRVINRILNPDLTGPETQKTFFESFKQATYGSEKKKFSEKLTEFVNKLRTSYCASPDSDKWGVEHDIWPKGLPWKAGSEDAHTVLEEHLQILEGKESKFDISMQSIIRALLVFDSHSTWPDALSSTLGKRLMKQALLGEGCSVKYGSANYEIDENIYAALKEMFANVLFIEISRTIKQTQGTYKLLAEYETMYRDISRSSGDLTFSDIQYLLSEDETLLTEKKMYIDWRLNCMTDHWLIDEFQDTSDMQWSILRNLIEEIIQSPDGDRSFFYVGDVKQSIYGWRGGNYRLFHKLLEYYNSNDEVIKIQTLAETRRCSVAVVDFVNKVFGTLSDEQIINSEGLPSEAVEKWKSIWEEHKALPDAPAGYVEVIEPAKTGGRKSKQDNWATTAELLKKIKSENDGLTTGILVRGNNDVKNLTHLLRSECPDMTIVNEGKAGIIDNQLAQCMLKLVMLTAHPGDEYAWQYLHMTPMGEILPDRDKLSEENLTMIQEDGFLHFVNYWGEEFNKVHELDEYHGKCFEYLKSAAQEFDNLNMPDCDAFVDFINDYEIREAVSETAVRIMTMHQAKGLEFDIVIIPETGESWKNMLRPPVKGLSCSGETSDPDWILKMPRRQVAECDSVLSKQMEKEMSEECFATLCLLYVAMTRAKHGLYIIAQGQGKTATSLYPQTLIRHQLGLEIVPDAADESTVIYSSDYKNEAWYKDFSGDKAAEHIVETISNLSGIKEKESHRNHLEQVEPSKQADIEKNAAKLFETRSIEIMNFGLAIHELLEKIEWIEDAAIDEIIEDWEPGSQYDEQVTKDVLDQFRNCVQAQDIKKYLSKPEGGPVLWREKRFDIVMDNKLVSGAFDRVTIKYDKGKPVSATILDYKSSVIDDDSQIDKKAKDYTPQMTAYREALSHILKLDKKNIDCILLFTRHQVVREVRVIHP